MATCGNCKNTHVSVNHIRQCYHNRYAQSGTVVAPVRHTADALDDMHRRTPAPEQPNPWTEINDMRSRVTAYLVRKPSGQRVGYFAINVVDGLGGAPIKFYRVKRAANGRIYLDVQASDDYHPVRSPQANKLVLSTILKDPVKAAELYASSLGRCYRCGRTLTDETSRSVGMGPECRSK